MEHQSTDLLKAEAGFKRAHLPTIRAVALLLHCVKVDITPAPGLAFHKNNCLLSLWLSHQGWRDTKPQGGPPFLLPLRKSFIIFPQ